MHARTPHTDMQIQGMRKGSCTQGRWGAGGCQQGWEGMMSRMIRLFSPCMQWCLCRSPGHLSYTSRCMPLPCLVQCCSAPARPSQSASCTYVPPVCVCMRVWKEHMRMLIQRPCRCRCRCRASPLARCAHAGLPALDTGHWTPADRSACMPINGRRCLCSRH
jgi:hypothetical protein